jgi:hypothetical protein
VEVFQLSPNLEGQVPVYTSISLRKRMVQEERYIVEGASVSK